MSWFSGVHSNRGFAVPFHPWSFPQKRPVTRTTERKERSGILLSRFCRLKESLPNFRAQCLFVQILQASSASQKSSGYLFFPGIPFSAGAPVSFPCGVGGKVPPAAISDRMPSVNRAAGQYLGTFSFPTSMGGHCSALRGKPAILNKSPLSVHLRFGGSELTYSSI